VAHPLRQQQPQPLPQPQPRSVFRLYRVGAEPFYDRVLCLLRGTHALLLARRILRLISRVRFSGSHDTRAVYCCKEHQTADWPAHEAACKAARKAAAVADGAGASREV
jgi:hypothetical protein